LETSHTFSFAGYRDPQHMGFRSLRVINEDRVRPGAGFPTHSHQDMEIVTWVIEGLLEHKDSLGNGSLVRPGEVQRLSAGTGVTHSEYNASGSEAAHFLQIWILPERQGADPGYEQIAFGHEERDGRLCLIGSREGRSGSVTIHQNVDLYACLLSPGQEVTHDLRPGRHAWLQVTRGTVRCNAVVMVAGDGAAISDEGPLVVIAGAATEFLLFDLA
jgi:redox-sensitive bicupin YhaK (pirin superfamily)